jgi:ATP-binding cassette subfamily B protein
MAFAQVTFISFSKLRQTWRDSILGRLLGENIRRQRLLYIVSLIAMSFEAVTISLMAWMMKSIVDTMTNPEDRAAVVALALSIAVVFIIKGIATYIQVISLQRAGNRIVASQQSLLYAKLLRQGVAFFNLTESSQLLMRITQGAQAARSVIDLIVTSFVRDLLTLVGLASVMVVQQPYLALFSLIVGPLAIFAIRILLTKVRSIVRKEAASMAEIIKVIQETAAGVRIIKAFAIEDRMSARMTDAVSQVEQRSNAIARLEAAAGPIMETLSGITIAAVVILSAFKMLGGADQTPGQLISFVTALLMAYEPAKRLSQVRVSIESGMVGVKMMYELLDHPETMVEHPTPIALPQGAGLIELQDVSFAYDPERPVMQGMNLTFAAGKTTALVGASGGGKSTLINLIMRLYDPVTGVVRIDGADLREVSFASLRRAISFVGQDTFLFSDTVRENIRCGDRDADEAAVIAAAKSASAHDFIMALPQGYDTLVGENGAFLSGGQRQRLAIARAMLHRGRILLLDEATSALDPDSEVLVQEALERLSQGVTTVVIAHRLSTILNADTICVIEGGAVTEQGSLTELLARNGRFASLFHKQFGHVASITDRARGGDA